MNIRFRIKCPDGVARYVFCRSLNGYDKHTRSGVITTECRDRAYQAFSFEQAEKDKAYFGEHSHGLLVEIESNERREMQKQAA